jgi:hypothetical protein
MSWACVRLCFFRSLDCVKRATQPGCTHGNGFSPVCVSICLVRLLDLRKLLPQKSQACDGILMSMTRAISSGRMTRNQLWLRVMACGGSLDFANANFRSVGGGACFRLFRSNIPPAGATIIFPLAGW